MFRAQAGAANPLDSEAKISYSSSVGGPVCPPETRNMIAAPHSTYLGIAAQSTPLKPLLPDRSSGVAAV
jgi:hypothetical protein